MTTNDQKRPSNGLFRFVETRTRGGIICYNVIIIIIIIKFHPIKSDDDDGNYYHSYLVWLGTFIII